MLGCSRRARAPVAAPPVVPNRPATRAARQQQAWAAVRHARAGDSTRFRKQPWAGQRRDCCSGVPGGGCWWHPRSTRPRRGPARARARSWRRPGCWGRQTSQPQTTAEIASPQAAPQRARRTRRRKRQPPLESTKERRRGACASRRWCLPFCRSSPRSTARAGGAVVAHLRWWEPARVCGARGRRVCSRRRDAALSRGVPVHLVRLAACERAQARAMRRWQR